MGTGFGNALRSVMVESGVNGSDLSRRVGVSYQAVQSVLRKDNPSIEVAVRYLNELGYDVALVRKGKRLPDGSYVMGRSEE